MLRERQDKLSRKLASGGALGDPESYGVAVGRFLEIEDLLMTKYQDMQYPKRDAQKA